MASVQIAMNMVAGVEIAQIWPTKWQDPIPPSTLASSAIQPAATASSSTVARRIFQLGSAPSNPSLPIFLVTSHLRMVLVHDLEHEWTTVAQGPGEEEWVIVDYGSDVSHLFTCEVSSSQWFRFCPCCVAELPQQKIELVATTLDGE